MIKTSEKIRILLGRKNSSVTELALKIEQSRQNITNKLSRNNLSETDMREMANALNCDVEIKFIDRDTKEEL